MLRLSRKVMVSHKRKKVIIGASMRGLSSSSSETEIPAVRRSQVASKRDITGSKLSLSISRDGLTLIDEAIMNMITSESDPLPQIRECLSIDKDCALAHALLVMELCRNPAAFVLDGETERDHDAVVRPDEIKASLENMETNFVHLNERERYLGAASLQCVRGHYSKAAALLESAIMLNPGDAISLRLAQDCYTMAGDAKNALSCVTRCLQTMDDGHFLHGHLMGMMAVGYVENGYYYEAEETSSRAVARTKGRDISALGALLSTLQLTGRSSELLSTLEKHESKFEGTGLISLLYNKGCAYVQRGNYRGATRTLDVMLDLIGDIKDANAGIAAPLTHATLLLWQIGLYNQDAALLERWQSEKLSSMWLGVDPLVCAPVHAVARTLCLAVRTMGREEWGKFKTSDKGERAAKTSMKDKKGAAEGGGSSMDGILSWLTKQQVQSTEDAGIERIAAGSEESKVDDTALDKDASPKAGEMFSEEGTKALEAHLEALQRCQRGEGTDLTESSLRMLSSIEPSFALATRPPEVLHDIYPSERAWLFETSVQPIAQGLVAQTRLDYASSAAELNRAYPVLSRMGGTMVLRDVIAQTLILFFLRADRLVEARLLLCERTTLTPNDAQSWRRLALVFDKMGEDSLAEVAHYTAWQLGIGQGGFGGPK